MRRLYVNIKMVIDFFIALVLLPILMLVLIPSAICIKLEDGGPVLYGCKDLEDVAKFSRCISSGP